MFDNDASSLSLKCARFGRPVRESCSARKFNLSSLARNFADRRRRIATRVDHKAQHHRRDAYEWRCDLRHDR